MYVRAKGVYLETKPLTCMYVLILMYIIAHWRWRGAALFPWFPRARGWGSPPPPPPLRPTSILPDLPCRIVKPK
jgi:hypothetical protein